MKKLLRGVWLGAVVSVAALLTISAHAETVLVGWTFPTNNLIADLGIAANVDSSNRYLSAVGELGTLSFPSSQRSAPHYTGWDGGAGTNCWLIQFTTAGYTNITVSSKQRSSNTGPQHFFLQYRLGDQGEWQSLPSVGITLADNWTMGVLDQLSLPEDVGDQPIVQVRWLMQTETSVNNGSVASTGASGIDDVFVHGILRDDLPPPAVPVALMATSVREDAFVANWGAVTGNVAGYELEVATSDSFAYAGEAILVDFEGVTKGNYDPGTRELSGLEWGFAEALIGSLANDWKEGERSLRMRGYEASAFTLLEDLSGGLSEVSFMYRRYGTDPQVDWKVEYSVDQGAAWTQIGDDFTAPDTDDVQTFSEVVSASAPVRVRIVRATMDENETNDRRLNIDNILLEPFFTIDEVVSGYDPLNTTANSALVEGLEPGAVHYYRVRTVGLGGVRSDWSNVIRVTSRPPTVLILF